MLVFRVTECVTDVCYSSCLFSSTVFVLALKSMSISALNICERNLSLRVVVTKGCIVCFCSLSSFVFNINFTFHSDTITLCCSKA